MVMRMLHLGLQKRIKWVSMWLEPPSCFALMDDPQYGPAAASVLLDITSSALQHAPRPLFYGEIASLLEGKHDEVRLWWSEFGLDKCEDEVRSLISMCGRMEHMGTNVLMRLPKLLKIFSVEFFARRHQQMVLENIFSKINAILEESLSPTQIAAQVKFLENTAFPILQAAVAAHPVSRKGAGGGELPGIDAYHASADAGDFDGDGCRRTKQHIPGYSTAQILHVCELVKEKAASYRQYEEEHIRSAVFKSRAKAGRGGVAADSDHVRHYNEARSSEIGGKNRVSGVGNQKARSSALVLAEGSKHSIDDMLSVKGNTSANHIANENNPQCWQYYAKVIVTKSKHNPTASFKDLRSQVSHHLPAFNPAAAGVASAMCSIYKCNMHLGV